MLSDYKLQCWECSVLRIPWRQKRAKYRGRIYTFIRLGNELLAWPRKSATSVTLTGTDTPNEQSITERRAEKLLTYPWGHATKLDHNANEWGQFPKSVNMTSDPFVCMNKKLFDYHRSSYFWASQLPQRLEVHHYLNHSALWLQNYRKPFWCLTIALLLHRRLFSSA